MHLSAIHLSHPAQPLPAGGARVRVVWLVMATLGLMVFAQLGRIPVASAGAKDAPLYLHDLSIVVLLAAAAICHVAGRPLRVDSTTGAVLLFAAVGGISTLLAVPRFGLTAFEAAFSMAYLARWLMYFAVYVVILNFVGLRDVWTVWNTLLFTVLAIVAFGVVQAAFLPDFAQMLHPEARLYLDWDPQGHRLVSTLLDPNYAGALIVLVLLPAIGMAAYGARVSPVALGLLFMGLVLTLSRGAFVGLAAGLAVVVAVRGIPRRFLGYAAGAFAVLALLSPAVVRYGIEYNKFDPADASAFSRVVGWMRSLEMFADHPVIGIGFNTLGFVQQQRYGLDEVVRASFGLDGGLLVVAVLTGTVGLLIYLAMVGSVLARCRRLWRSDGVPARERGFAVGVAAATAAMLTHGFFFNTLFAPFILHGLFTLWALTAVIHGARGPGRAPPAPSAPAGAA
jgi:O-antigen ligase